MRYGARMGSGPNRRWLTARAPAFFESYTKYPWAYSCVCSAMIFTVFLFAPTVPSEPRPQNNARVTDSGSMSRSGRQLRLVPPTSSWMPIVK